MQGEASSLHRRRTHVVDLKPKHDIQPGKVERSFYCEREAPGLYFPFFLTGLVLPTGEFYWE